MTAIAINPDKRDVSINPGSKGEPDRASVSFHYHVMIDGKRHGVGSSVTIFLPHNSSRSIPDFEKIAYQEGAKVLRALADYLDQPPD